MTGEPTPRLARQNSDLTRHIGAQLRALPLSFTLIGICALLTALVVSSVFVALSVEIRSRTRRLFAEQLGLNQRSLLDLQNRSLSQLLWTSRVMTESPTLRAAMETYRVESTVGNAPRKELLATIQREVEGIAAGLGTEKLVVTDERGRVLAATARAGVYPGVGEDLSRVPAVQHALDPYGSLDPSNFAILEFGNSHYQFGCVPIVMRGFTIGTVLVGERLDRTYVAKLEEFFDGEIVVATNAEIITSTITGGAIGPPQLEDLMARMGELPTDVGTFRLDDEEYVIAGLPLGADRAGQKVALHLLHSLTDALEETKQALLVACLLYGSIAVVLAGLSAGAVSQTVLTPFRGFVRFMRVVAESGDYSRRFDASRSTLEIRSLNDTYAQLIRSLAQNHDKLEQRTKQLARSNDTLTQQIAERERAEQALRESEEQLRQSQKLEAIGTLAGGVAHDFNNLLTVISSYGELLISEVGADSPMRSDLEQVREAAGRAAVLTNQLLAFSRKQVLQPKVIDLNAAVDEIEKMLRRLIGEDIEIRTVKQRPLPRVKADPGQIEQVIMNLAINARDAMPKGGELTISTASVESVAGALEASDSPPPGAWVKLSVTDSGVGMDAATQGRIFEPFFTTKELGKGTGLGLSTVYGIVKQSAGNLSVRSSPGEGTTFDVYLPRVAEPIKESGRVSGENLAVGGNETILLVEDEDLVRALAERTLRVRGYHVLAARAGDEAIGLAAEHSGPIHLLLTDVVMPLMSGKDLEERLAPMRPEMRVLYMSGYTDDAIVHHGVLDPGTEFLPKPFTPTVLLRRVREVLDTPKEAGRNVPAPTG